MIMPTVNLFGIAPSPFSEVSIRTNSNINNVWSQDMIGFLPNLAGLDSYKLAGDGLWKKIATAASYLWNMKFFEPSEESLRGLTTRYMAPLVSSEMLGGEIKGKDEPHRPSNGLLGFQIICGGIDPQAVCGYCTGDAVAEILVFQGGRCL